LCLLQSALLSGCEEVPRSADTPEFVADLAFVVVVSPEGAARATKIWLASLDGRSESFYQPWICDSRNPDVSPDGRRVLYQSCDSARSPGEPDEIYVADPRELLPRRLTRNLFKDELPHWAPDGRRIAFQSDGTGTMQIFVTDDTGGHPTQVTHSVEPCRIGGWSPDGGAIAFCSSSSSTSGSHGQILTVAASGGGEKQLTAGPGDKSDPAWSPTGTEIAFLQEGNVYRVAASGGESSLVADAGDSIIAPLEWSPDGRFLFFTLSEGGRTDICRVTREGTDLRRLTSGSGSAWHPAVLPDGEQLAYVEYFSLYQKVMLMDFEGYGRRELTSLKANETAPVGRRWTYSGRK
jgi:Tol biopolymer transport system component